MKHVNACMAILVFVIINSVFFYGCKNEINSPVSAVQFDNSGQVNRNFSFSTKKDFRLTLSTASKNITAKPGVAISISAAGSVGNDDLIATLFTDASGMIDITLKLPSTVDKLFIRTTEPGLPSEVQIPAAGNSWNGNYESAEEVPSAAAGSLMKNTGLNLRTLGTWNSIGVPNYLITPRDNIANSLLQKINYSLPEMVSVVSRHPEYLALNNATTTEITERADVWVTFVHEGAGYKNVFGYYTYNKLNPPEKAADISSTMTVVFPNTSYYNSGGGLYSGDKVYLGTFDAGTVLGWFVVSNGFSGGQINNGVGTFYSNTALNSEASASLKQHTVILKDPDSDKLVIGFEDMSRDNPGCDHDFNDVLFYVTSNPIKAIPVLNTPLLSPPVTGNQTAQTFLPAKNAFGTLVFEDLWPNMGDYDFNDLVVDYNFTLTSDQNNKVTSIDAHFKIKAIGAGMHNGFAIELPVDAANVASVTGSVLKNNYISLNDNGTESGQQKAVIIVFDDAYGAMNNSGSTFVNTEITAPHITPVDIWIKIVFSQPQPITNLMAAPYNPFLIINKDRSREIHLPDMAPTSKANLALFKTGDDNSDPGAGRYYKNNDNMPWAMDIANSFKYPVERAPISQAYLNFSAWAKSSGLLYKDWYVYSGGNINDSKIYK